MGSSTTDDNMTASTEPQAKPVKDKRTRRNVWQPANDLIATPTTSPGPEDGVETAEPRANSITNGAGSAVAPQPMRSLGMNTYGGQASRQAPRLQNANKTGLGGATNQWGAFGMPTAAGFGALGGAPGLPQQRPQQLSGFAQVMGGGGAQGPIDMSDFPSLSGGPRAQQNSTASGWNSNAIRQPPVQQQHQAQQGQQAQQRAPSAAPSQQSLDQFDGQRSQQPPIERSAGGGGGGDEFPPLGGQLNGDLFSQSHGVGSGIGSPDVQQPRMNGQQTQMPIRDSSAFLAGPQQLMSQQQSQQSSQNGHPAPLVSNVKKYADMTEDEKWGLPGLMAAFEARRQMDNGGQVDETLPPALRSTVIMGHDLGALGLDLDSPDPLYPTFTPFQAIGSSGSSFDFHERNMIPDFTLPSAYTVTNVPPIQARITAFSDETLFSVFYQLPRDILQELAATELMQRDWRWHKILRQWLRKDDQPPRDGTTSSSSLPLVDLTNGAPLGTVPIRTGERAEKGVYVFFDAMNWRRERRWLELDYDHLDPGRMMPATTGVPPRLQAGAELGMGNSGHVGGVVGSSQIPSA